MLLRQGFTRQTVEIPEALGGGGRVEVFSKVFRISYEVVAMEDFSKHAAMRDHGARAEEVFRQARHDGFDTVACLRMVRQVFHLSLTEGKAVMIQADTGVSLQEHEENLIPGLKQALKETEEEFRA
jgi:hypothetical protein